MRVEKVTGTGKINYLVCQCERGDSGTPHVQGMLQCKNAISMQSAKARTSPGAHVEVAIRPKEARAYCMKEDTREAGPWELGEWRNEQGKRTDLELVRSAIDQERRMQRWLKNILQRLSNTIRASSAARMHIQRPQCHYIPKKVTLFYGMPGTGKTYFCLVTLGLKPEDVYVATHVPNGGMDTRSEDSGYGRVSGEFVSTGLETVPRRSNGGVRE